MAEPWRSGARDVPARRASDQTIPWECNCDLLAAQLLRAGTSRAPVHLKPAGLRFLNADEVARDLGIDAYEAAKVITRLRQELVRQRESFVFETVFSDPVGDKLGFLKEAARSGYSVVVCFIGIDGPETSEQRVAMRVSQGGHDCLLRNWCRGFHERCQIPGRQ